MKTNPSKTWKIQNSSAVKTSIFAGICTLLAIAAQAELPATITTTDGQTYNGVSLVRAEPDGYLINYKPQDNGVGMAKIKFSRLSSDMQKQAGYDADKAKRFETDVAKANEDWRQENLKREEAGKAERQARQAAEQQQEQLALQRMTLMAQLKMAEAAGENKSSGDNNGYGWSSLSGYGGYGLIALPSVDTGKEHRVGNGIDNINSFHPFPELSAYPLGRPSYVAGRAIRPPFTPSR